MGYSDEMIGEIDSSPKYESPYSADLTFQSPSLKRQLSDQFQGSADKRQRTDLGSTSIDHVDLSALIIQPNSCTPQQYLSLKAEPHNVPQARHDFHQKDNIVETYKNGFLSDPLLYMRILSLPILESLATQILSILAQDSYHEIIRIANSPDCELGHAFSTLKTLFDQTKKFYNQHEPFISADALNINEPEHRTTIRLANLATFVSIVFCGHDVGFLELNDHFIKTFAIEGIPLAKESGDLFLNLKTQIYLSAVSQEEQERTREDILEDFFPNDLDKLLESRHPNQPLSQAEMEFTKDYISRRESLANSPVDLDSIQALSERFSWEGFLKQLGAFLSKLSLLALYMKKHNLNVPVANPHSCLTENTPPSIDDIELQIELAAKQTLESLGLAGLESPHDGNENEAQFLAQNRSYLPDYSNFCLPKEQTAPTQVLYERARQAAAAKTSPSNTRRPGLPSQRRPWSGEEERALMAGLDQVRGPHWSQILAMYGTKGTISEVLKDRNQVQLKDKARNLKLFFLKSGIEVPYYLKTVTGELKTRAPTQAAKREAEERARDADKDDQMPFEKVLLS